MKDRIKELRKAFKETQQTFGNRLNVSKSTIEAIEYGRREATDRIIADICREYNANETWLRSGEGEMLAPMNRNQEIASITAQLFKADESDFRYQLTKILYDMDEDQIELLKDIVYKLRDGLM